MMIPSLKTLLRSKEGIQTTSNLKALFQEKMEQKRDTSVKQEE